MGPIEEALTKARNKIAEPVDWTRGARARDALGNGVSAYSPEAVTFCALGAIDAATGGGHWYDEAVRLLEMQVGYVPEWNDARGRTHTQVLTGFDRAIADAAGRGI